MFEIIVLTTAVIVNLFLSFLVLQTDPQFVSNRYFCSFTITMSLWNVGTYWSLNPAYLSQLSIVRLVLLFAVLQVTFLYVSITGLPDKTALNFDQKMSLLIGLLVAFFTQTPLVYKHVYMIGTELESVVSAGIVLFGLFQFVMLARVFIFILHSIRTFTSKNAQQVKTVATGLAISFSLIAMSNFVFVHVVHSQKFIGLGPAFSIIVVLFYSFSIFRYRMYEVPLIILRATSYTFSFALAIIAPSTLVILLINQILAQLTLTDRIIVVGMALTLAAASFNGYKQFFDRVTDRVFRKMTEKKKMELKNLNMQIKKATKEIEKEKNSLTEMNRIKDEFIAIASHQLRTPITIASLNNKMLIEEAYGSLDKKQLLVLSDIQTNVEQMLGIVDNLLDVARIEQGKFTVQKESAEFSALVRGVIKKHQNILKDKNLDLKLRLKSKSLMIEIDTIKISEVISNIIDNAIKYSPRDSAIEVVSSVDDGELLFMVRDSGIGVADEDQKKLFTKFGRSQEAISVKPDGMGLGLYLAKKILEAHGGQVTYKCRIDGGSEFGFSLPI